MQVHFFGTFTLIFQNTWKPGSFSVSELDLVTIYSINAYYTLRIDGVLTPCKTRYFSLHAILGLSTNDPTFLVSLS